MLYFWCILYSYSWYKKNATYVISITCLQNYYVQIKHQFKWKKISFDKDVHVGIFSLDMLIDHQKTDSRQYQNSYFPTLHTVKEWWYGQEWAFEQKNSFH